MKPMMKTAALALGLLLSSSAALAAGAADGVRVADPYVRAMPPGQPNSAAFMRLENAGAKVHALVGAESPAAKVVELHTHTMDGGMMRMRPVERIDLPPGQPVDLNPGGYHVMLIGLVRQLVPGDEVALTLVFDDGTRKSVAAPVRKVQAMMHH